MFSKYLASAILLLPAMTLADLCSNYRVMTLGRLILINNANVDAYVQYRYTGTTTWVTIGPIVAEGAQNTYTRAGTLSGIQTDREFELQVCDDSNIIGDDCVVVDAIFNIPPSGSAVWEADITVVDEGIASFNPVCDVAGPA